MIAIIIADDTPSNSSIDTKSTAEPLRIGNRCVTTKPGRRGQQRFSIVSDLEWFEKGGGHRKPDLIGLLFRIGFSALGIQLEDEKLG